MSLSIQTNVDSLVAQENLRVNSLFQSRTIQRLTSGYRINSSGDDAAGLAVANRFRSSVAELMQGVRNANDGLSQLQIIDGGLNNISQIMDRMKTLATESASTTFTGDRTTLNNEYQSLITEINRQSANIGLNAGGTYNTSATIYIGGGGSVQGNSQVLIDLSGSGNQVDANGLAVANTNLLGAGSIFSNPVNLNTVVNGMVLAGNVGGDSQVITVNLAGGQRVTVTVQSTTAGGITVSQAIQQINSQLAGYGITASVDNASGSLMLTGSVAFEAAGAATANATTGVVTNTSTVINQAMNSLAGAASFTALSGANTEGLTFSSGGTSIAVTLALANAGSLANAVQTLNNSLAVLGVKAVVNAAGTGIDFESANSFSVSKANGSGGTVGVFAANGGGGAVVTSSTAPSSSGSSTGNSLNAVTAIGAAIASLGLVQGRVGAGENKLNYAIQLAQSQISSFSAAESRIRDADVAAEAANLTKAQVLEQASIAAMAQANATPQAVLSLLKG